MGCVIHAHMEIRLHQSGYEHFARFHLPRDYRLFWVLAGVRADDADPAPPFPPRGLPKDLDSTTADAFSYEISDEAESLEIDGYCSSQEAASWVEQPRAFAL